MENASVTTQVEGESDLDHCFCTMTSAGQANVTRHTFELIERRHTLKIYTFRRNYS